PVGDFTSDPLAYLEHAYSEYVPETTGIYLKQMAEALSDTKPTTQGTTFGDLMGHLLRGDSDKFFYSLADASMAARAIGVLTLAASALPAAYQVYQSQTPLDEGQKQGFELGGALIGMDAGATLAGTLSKNPYFMGLGALIGGLAGTPLGKDFYDNV